MRFLFLLSCLLLATASQAVTFTKYKSSLDGELFQTFVFEKKGVTFKKSSNYFDEEKDLRLGSFHLKGNIPKVQAQLEKIHQKVKASDNYLKSVDSSFNQLSGNIKHESFFLIGEYRITHQSDLYKELEEIFAELIDLEWHQQQGIALAPDLKQLQRFSAGKIQSKSAFDLSQCQSMGTSYKCLFEGEGVLYVVQ